jgi:outer membrane immunogenic protein
MRHLHSTLLAGLACVVAIPAVAADLSRPAPITKAPIAPIAAIYDWTGFYVGGNVGGKWGRFDEVVNAPVSALAFTGDSDASFVGGGQLGFMWQSGQFVFGVEGDIDATRLRNTFTAVAPVPAPFLAGDTLALRNDWQASARGRLGWAWDRVLVYATGGGAWANLKATGTAVGGGLGVGAVAVDRTVFGWTVGGGLDYGIAPGWSLGAEYRFTRFDDTDNNGTAFGTLAGTPLFLSSRLDTHEVTARLNYHFNMGGPVVARY